MKASIAWLKDYVDLSGFSPREISDKLTMAGLEVETLSDRYDYLNKVVAAKLVTVVPHPKSDHLKCCEVDAGPHGSFKIVCGAPNAQAGMVSALALIGCELPGGLVIKATELRGQPSCGMLCSEAELGLGVKSGGIMELSAEVGQSLKEVTGLTDWVLEVGITPNRPDALSIIGLARDLSALLNRPLKMPETAVPENGPPVNTLAQVEIKVPELAPRFVGRVIKGVKIGPSPGWLKERLAGSGIRSINNVVDITNYVMMEMGQPLHAYDLRTLAGHRIVVDTYEKGRYFTTLDGQNRLLTAELNLMIMDAEKAVGLAGIMGGLNSEIQPDTTDILLEGAFFKSTGIRRTSRSLGLSTDASYRFERGGDPEICAKAVDRAMALMAELAGGSVAQGAIDVYPNPYVPLKVRFSPEKCNTVLGTSHQPGDMVRVLTAIGLKMTPDGDAYIAELPSWRPDLSREIDVVEEVARLLDFDSLPATLPSPPQVRQTPPATWTLRAQVREALVAQGFSEALSYSFINPNFADKLALPADSLWRARMLPLLNPLSEEHGVLRPLMAPCLINALKHNQYHGARQVALFETGAVFLSNGTDRQPDERLTIGGIMAGYQGQDNWVSPARPTDFWDIKGVVETLAAALNLKINFSREGNLPVWYNPAEAAAISLENGQTLGHLGRLGAKAAKAFGLKEAGGPVYIFEIDGQIILEHGFQSPDFKNWGKFPSAEWDLAVVVNKEVMVAEMLKTIEGGPWPLVGVTVFDQYEGGQLPEGCKSLAFRLTFQDRDKTLNDEEIKTFFEVITKKLGEQFAAVLRS